MDRIRREWAKKYESWCLNGKRHKENGPAVIKYYESGQKEYEAWYRNGEFHREDGPAYIVYDKDGRIKEKTYYLNGNEITEKEFMKYKKVNDLLKEVKSKKKISL